MGRSHQARLTAVFCLFAGAAAADVACAPDRLTIQGGFGQARFNIAVADDPEERAQGLMNVPYMPTMSGMLFVYPEPRIASFWMRNTLISLDMLFADETGTIRHIHAGAVPLDETPILGGEGIQYVFEINGGLAARLGIAEGDLIAHPAIGAAAALPCAG